MTSNNIPKSLRALRQWVCFDVEGSNKIAFIPGTDKHAASNRPTEWRSFEEALADVESGARQHLGFCFSSTDPYTFIDLDDITDEEQQAVFDRIDTYAQRSVSGKGIHLIAKGSFEGPGRHPKKPHAGIFQENRFCLFTGLTLPNRTKIRTVPDEDLQQIHKWLSNGHAHTTNGHVYELNTTPPEIPHMTIYQWGCDVFGSKYRDLACGKWEDHPEYNGDHSAADYGLIAMLCDLTDSDAQVRDLFSMSKMWNDERAIKKAGHGFEGYVNRSIKKYRAKQRGKRAMRASVEINIGPVEDVEIEEEVDVPETGDTSLLDSLPEGLIKDIAQHSFESSHLPLQESSICVALALMSVIAGRGFLSPTDEGLNVWPILVGGTGCGKGGYKSGIKRFLDALSVRLPHAHRMLRGSITSSAGIETALKGEKRQISYNPEFGSAFNNLANGGDNTVTSQLRQGMLDTFDTAGAEGSYEGRRTAENVGEVIKRPLIIFAGETTPDVLYGGLEHNAVLSGFIQRFLLIDVGAKSLSSPRRGERLPVPSDLIDRLEQLTLQMDKWDAQDKSRRVGVSGKAEKLLWDHSYGLLMKMRRETASPIMAELSNRSASKAARLASLLAVSEDHARPVIKERHVIWAIDFVTKLDATLVARFTNGDIATGQPRQEAEILKAIRAATGLSYSKRLSCHMSPALAKTKNICPYSFIKRAVIQHGSFTNDRSGAVTALSNRLSAMAAVGELVMLDATDAADLGEPGKRLFYIPK